MNENIKFQITKVIRSNRAKVFEAWADPNVLKQWFAPGALIIPKTDVDFKVGGFYSIDLEGEMRDQQTKGSVSGTYKKIITNELLVFTFKGTWQESAPETLVTIMFRDVKDGTEITLTHEHFADTQARANHKHGWESSLEKLDKLVDTESKFKEVNHG